MRLLALATGGLTGLLAVESPAPSTFFWQGAGTDANWTNPANWEAGLVPPNADHTELFFDYAFNFSYPSLLHLDSSRVAGTLFFGTNFDVSGAPGSILTLHQGLEVTSGEYYYASFDQGHFYGTLVRLRESLTLTLAATNDWYVGYDAWLISRATLSGSHDLHKTGAGRLDLAAPSPDFTGDLYLEEGGLAIGHDEALGTGTLRIGPLSLYASTELIPLSHNQDDLRTISNPVIITDHLHVGEPFEGGDGAELKLSGPITLLGNTVFRLYETALWLTGTIAEPVAPAKITIADSSGVAIFAGTSGFTGGLHAEEGGAVFLQGTALPASGAFSSGTSGYIGLADPTTDMASFLARFTLATTTGAIGFDTNPDQFLTPHTFQGNIDLTGFHADVRLGSVSSARLDGTLTPTSQAADYRFGTGGGTLHVRPPLTGDRGVTVDSPAASQLMVVLESVVNSFTGNITVSHSGIRFLPGALPASANFVVLTNDAYIGAHEDAAPNDFIARFPTTLTGGIIGFDGHIGVSGLDLSRFTATTARIYLGTSTSASISGPITLASGMPYRFTGYRGGQLTVNSVLDADVALHIGHPSHLGDHYDNDTSSVRLNAANPRTGNTYLIAGALIPGHDEALGTGSLFVEWAYEASSKYLRPQLHIPADAGPTGRTLANDIYLSTDLTIQLDARLKLTGQIAGSNHIELRGTSTTELELSGQNHGFYGDFRLNSGNLVASHDQALANAVLFFSPDSNSSVIFTTTMPEIRGLHTTVANQPVSVNLSPTSGDPAKLTIYTGYEHFSFGGTIAGNGSLSIRSGGGGEGDLAPLIEGGGGSQSFTGLINLTGGIAVESGARLSLTNEATFGADAGPITLDGGILRLDHAYNAVANVSFGSAGGRLEGNGTLNPIGGAGAAALAFGPGTVLAPGASIGSLELGYDVVFASGGTLEFELADNGMGGLISDSLQLHALSLTATTEAPFNLRIGTTYYWLDNFNLHAPQQWEIFSTQEVLGALNLAAFAVSWDHVNPYTGNFGLTQVGNSLNLNFTPIPEPSTAVLLLLGLGLLAAYRPRRER